MIWFITWINIGDDFTRTTSIPSNIGIVMNAIVLIGLFILLFSGVFFGFKSNKIKESAWAGNLCTVMGIVVIVGYLLLMSGFAGY